MFAAQLSRSPQETGGLKQHPGGTLDQRLEHERGEAGTVLDEGSFERREGRGNPVRMKEQRLEDLVKQIDAAQADCADGVPVIGVVEHQEAGALGVSGQLLRLKRELEGDLGRRRTGVGIEDPAQTLRCDLDELSGQLDGGHIAEPEERAVRDPIELATHRAIDGGMTVPMHIAPQGAHPIEVTIPLGVDELVALGPGDDEGVFVEPRTHGRERMPEKLLVECAEAGGLGSHLGAGPTSVVFGEGALPREEVKAA